MLHLKIQVIHVEIHLKKKQHVVMHKKIIMRALIFNRMSNNPKMTYLSCYLSWLPLYITSVSLPRLIIVTVSTFNGITQNKTDSWKSVRLCKGYLKEKYVKGVSFPVNSLQRSGINWSWLWKFAIKFKLFQQTLNTLHNTPWTLLVKLRRD